MTSKINGLNGAPVKAPEPAAVTRVRSSTTGDGARPQPQAPGGVQITESARQLAALEATLSRLSQVDEARVAKIRKAIESGSYTVDAEATATKLLVFEHDLESLVRTSRRD
ncbi:MAG: flagellar biosynthesis anti-sigma factor FlgM [Steroidobacteraceae bacterium]